MKWRRAADREREQGLGHHERLVRPKPQKMGVHAWSENALTSVSPGRGTRNVCAPAEFSEQTQTAATAAITGAGLTVGRVTQAHSSTVTSGSVISQLPGRGTTVSPGTPVNLTVLTVSKGPEPVTVPDVVGMTPFNTGTALVNALLAVGAVTQVYCDTTRSGQVVSQDPTAGTAVVPDTEVNLDVSKGPEFA